MSVKYGLLALLERGPMYGYQLRAAFEESTGGTWPLNIGQVYTTLSRLERDDLVRPLPESDGGGAAVVRDHRRRPGRAGRMVRHPGKPRRPAARRAGHQARARADHARRRRAQRGADPTHRHDAHLAGVHPVEGPRQPADLSWRLVLDAMLFHGEAELRWLDHCEASMVRYTPPPVPTTPTPAVAARPAPDDEVVSR